MIEELIRTYGLQPHPEGGYFKESYRSWETISRASLPERFSGDRSFATAIYYLLPKGARSCLHRIAADEIWHFYLGEPLAVIEITPQGKLTRTLVGPGHLVQHVVPAGHWFGAEPVGDFSFVGCTVAPGFDFADFEMATRSGLLAAFPQHRAVIESLTDAQSHS